MKLKLDENLGRDAAELFRQAGHDPATVAGEGLAAISDRELIEICRRERRCLVTLDLDFGNPLLFKPSEYAGIAVLRLPAKPTPHDLVVAIQTLLGGLTQGDITGKLWIVQAACVREYQEDIAD